MLLTMLPLTVFATVGMPRVYCLAPEHWSQCYVYRWGSSTGESTTWPGVPMNLDANGIWYYDVPTDSTGVIFDNGNFGGSYEDQTADLTVPTDDLNMYIFEGAYWTTYSGAVATLDTLVVSWLQMGLATYDTQVVPDDTITYQVYGFCSDLLALEIPQVCAMCPAPIATTIGTKPSPPSPSPAPASWWSPR